MTKHLSLASASLGVLLLVLWQVRPGRARPLASVPVLQTWQPLTGFVDLHTHVMSNLAFGGRLFYGGVDSGSLLPRDPDCNQNVHATSEAQALGHDRSTHGDISPNNPCGDFIRWLVVRDAVQKGANPAPSDARGYPD